MRPLVVDAPFVALMLAAAASDLRRRVVPNRLVTLAVAVGLVGGLLARPGELSELVLWGCGAFLALLVPALISAGGLGMGDVKLAGVMGLFLGAAVVPALAVAFGFGAVAGAGIIAARGLEARDTALPFAPFLAFGGLVALMAGPQLIEIYLSWTG